ncbi:MAG: hypothetical protein GKR94_28745 [Gammaproteobacteria bacterium]|nr:hypothetical protein [Gammaproteobacteria bacterium]
MTLVEQRQAELQALESMSCFAFARTVSIAAAWAAAPVSFANDIPDVGIQAEIKRTESSIQNTEVTAARDSYDVQIFERLSAIYGDLLASQRDLDELATNVLYENLWDMYE